MNSLCDEERVKKERKLRKEKKRYERKRKKEEGKKRREKKEQERKEKMGLKEQEMNEIVSGKTFVMISGHIDLTKQEFDEHYVPRIKLHIEKNKYFIIGSARNGADRFAREYLLKFPNIYVVCCKPDYSCKPNHYKKRDVYMTKHSSYDIAFLRQNGLSAGSGTCSNIIRRKFGSSIEEKIFSELRNGKIEMKAFLEDEDLWQKVLRESKNLKTKDVEEIIDTIIKSFKKQKNKLYYPEKFTRMMFYKHWMIPYVYQLIEECDIQKGYKLWHIGQLNCDTELVIMDEIYGKDLVDIIDRGNYGMYGWHVNTM